jgi:hypothetical protein
MNLPCQHVMEASTYITVHYRNGIHASSRCMDSVQPQTPSIWMECILSSHIWHAECTRMINVATSQLMIRREDGIRGMDHSINPLNSRDAEQHMYKTRGSSSLVVQESKSDNSKVLEVSKITHRFLCHLKEPKIPFRAFRSRSFLNDPTDFQNPINLGKFYCNSCD